jgi:carboxyl-terminal processing protease
MNGIVYRYALQYTDNNRAELEKYNSLDAIEKYLDNKPLLSDFLRFAKDKGVEFNKEEYQTSKQLIEIELKAYIARNIIDNEGFYPILHQVDDIFKRAVEEAEKMKS